MDRALNIIVIGLALLAGCKEQAPSPPQKPAKVIAARTEAQLATVELTARAAERLGVETARVELRSVPGVRALGGECVVPPGRSSTLTAPFAGIILPVGDEIPPVGSVVGPGAAILRLVPLLASEGDLEVDAQQALEVAQARVEVAGARVRRAEELREGDAISQEALEIALEQLAVARATLKAARAQARRVGVAALDPDGGLVLSAAATSLLQEISVRAGQTVAAGVPLFVLEEFDPIWVRVSAYAGDLDTLDLSSTASVSRLSNSGAALRRDATPVQSPHRGNARLASAELYYQLSNADRGLRAGERVRVEIPLKAAGDALVVPWSAVVYDAYGGTWVYALDAPLTYSRRRVEVSRVAGARAVLSRGPELDTEVVSIGAAELFSTEFGTGK